MTVIISRREVWYETPLTDTGDMIWLALWFWILDDSTWLDKFVCSYVAHVRGPMHEHQNEAQNHATESIVSPPEI